jgi:hypothetical protein
MCSDRLRSTLIALRYVTLEVGNSPQALEFDVDMLGPDFYTVMTTSGVGNRYDTFSSSTHGKPLSLQRVEADQQIKKVATLLIPFAAALGMCSPLLSLIHLLSCSCPSASLLKHHLLPWHLLAVCLVLVLQGHSLGSAL